MTPGIFDPARSHLLQLPMSVAEPVCEAVREVIAQNGGIDEDLLMEAVLRAIPIEMIDYVPACCIRIQSFLMYAQQADGRLEVDPDVVYFDFDGRLLHSVNRASLMAALIAPVKVSTSMGGQPLIQLSIGEVDRIATALARGERVQAGYVLH